MAERARWARGHLILVWHLINCVLIVVWSFLDSCTMLTFVGGYATTKIDFFGQVFMSDDVSLSIMLLDHSTSLVNLTIVRVC